MLNYRDKRRIQSEYEFRHGLEKPGTKRWWAFINTPVAMFFLGTIAAGGITSGYHSARDCHEKAVNIIDHWKKLNDEIHQRYYHNEENLNSADYRSEWIYGRERYEHLEFKGHTWGDLKKEERELAEYFTPEDNFYIATWGYESIGGIRQSISQMPKLTLADRREIMIADELARTPGNKFLIATPNCGPLTLFKELIMSGQPPLITLRDNWNLIKRFGIRRAVLEDPSLH